MIISVISMNGVSDQDLNINNRTITLINTNRYDLPLLGAYYYGKLETLNSKSVIIISVPIITNMKNVFLSLTGAHELQKKQLISFWCI